ncbi:MAG: diacylglycerol kinase (ATP dependent) [Rhodobacteraceae bacterium HLUCCA12]|nr:MAG: diacylglycerol kinase (ATP dependent) [Rhodobacteraceae bacterium HLUCCA12]
MRAFLAEQCRRFGWTLIWSWRGWRAAWASERTLRQWSLANIVSAALAFALPLGGTERALILALGLLVLAAELLNTAIEETVNLVSTDEHPLAAKAKDCASAGVALTALAAGVAWAILLWDHIG